MLAQLKYWMYLFRRYTKSFGVKCGLNLFLQKEIFRAKLVKIHIPGYRERIFIRNKSSDIGVFDKIFVEKEYELDIPSAPKFIVDGGANVGYASIFFANKYPNAKVVSIEPEASNLDILQRNIYGYKNIQSIQSAIWSKKSRMILENPVGAECTFQVKEAQSNSKPIESITVDGLCAYSSDGNIDILKLDIEGAEKEVFSSNTSWLANIKILIIELHDRYVPGCSDAVYGACEKHGFRHIQKGENIIFYKSDQNL